MAARVDFLKNSMLASARFNRDINEIEKMSLGPWAVGSPYKAKFAGTATMPCVSSKCFT
jgi:hypothetical protein